MCKVLCSVVLIAALTSAAQAVSIEVIPAGDLTGGGLIAFDDFAAGEFPGINYDVIFRSGEALFAERFVGQTLSYSLEFNSQTEHDVLSGMPTGPLALQVGAAGQNLSVYHGNPYDSQFMVGLGHAGYPTTAAVGTGSIAVLFDSDQSEFGFDLVGRQYMSSNHTMTLDFFRRDGALIDSIVMSDFTPVSYGFRRVGGTAEIAGVSIWQLDPYGVGFDNLRYDVTETTGVVPEPVTLGTLILGVGALCRYVRKRQPA